MSHENICFLGARSLRSLAQYKYIYFFLSVHSRVLPPPPNTKKLATLLPFRLGDDKWKKATVIRRLDERSYEVMHHNQVYRRNREHLRSSRESPDVDSPVLLMPDPEPTPPRDGPGQGSTLQSRAGVTHKSHSKPVCANPREQPGRPADGQPFLRRSTRQRHEPKKLADFVKY